jgi:hypothetical protein
MMTDAPNVVFEDIFTVNEKDRDGKKFDKGSRLVHLHANPARSVARVFDIVALRHGHDAGREYGNLPASSQ